MKNIALAVLDLSLAAGQCWAAAAQLHTRKTATIDASVDKVWSTVKDFDGLSTWHPAVAKDEIVKGENNKAGAVRLLTLKDGGTIKEKLLSYDAVAHRFRYAILEGVLPVSSYSSSFVLKSLGENQTLATWSGHFKRKDVGDNPGEKENDKAAIDTVNAVYRAGLDNLKVKAETK